MKSVYSQKNDILLKTRPEIVCVRRASLKAASILSSLAKLVKPGISATEINDSCLKLIRKKGGKPSLLNYRGFPAAVCVSINQVATHGIPNGQILREGDLVSIDLALECDGWHGDCAASYIIGQSAEPLRRLLKAARESTLAGIRAARAGNRLGDVGHVIYRTAEHYGCRVLDKFVGHGIGRSLHEEPMILNFGEPGTGQPIVPGMVFTVEPILTLGSGQTEMLDDGWSVKTFDNQPCAQFEHTIAVFGDSTEILTRNS